MLESARGEVAGPVSGIKQVEKDGRSLILAGLQSSRPRSRKRIPAKALSHGWASVTPLGTAGFAKSNLPKVHTTWTQALGYAWTRCLAACGPVFKGMNAQIFHQTCRSWAQTAEQRAMSTKQTFRRPGIGYSGPRSKVRTPGKSTKPYVASMPT